MRLRGPGLWLAVGASLLLALIVVALAVWRDDILEAFLNPQIPYAVYRPPPAPNFATPAAWALEAAPATPSSPPADVFFVHPTTFDGGKDWNGPTQDRKAAALFTDLVAPNYAAPFARVGRLFAPRYRQASLYTSLTMFDDAVEAREFAYGDVKSAFEYYLAHLADDRPLILVGVEQGGALAARLLHDEIAPNPALRRRLVAAYLIETVVPADEFTAAAAIPACQRRDQAGCVLAWVSARKGDFGRVLSLRARSKVWSDQGRLIPLQGRPILCVNPLFGAAQDGVAPERLNLGAANATGLEWGARPGFMMRQVGAECLGGVLRVTRPRSVSLQPSGDWAERLKVPGYNLFWADLEADAQRRAADFAISTPSTPPA